MYKVSFSPHPKYLGKGTGTCGDPGGTGYLPALCKVSARLTAEYATCVSGVAVGGVMLLLLVFRFEVGGGVFVFVGGCHLKHHLTFPSSWLWQGGDL